MERSGYMWKEGVRGGKKGIEVERRGYRWNEGVRGGKKGI